ncbi:MAG: type II secretion system F family protein [Lachnospiraceae bacterium]|nr:type II secretion system F family protein [Lachnospiraceae bacterium]
MERCKKRMSCYIHRSCWQQDFIDYRNYYFTVMELVRYILEGCVILGIVSWLFYDSMVAFGLFILPFLYFYLNRKKKLLCEKRKQLLNHQFREVILAVSSHLQAGFSVENAFMEAYRDICVLFGEKSLMARELMWILRRVENNESLEQSLLQLAQRSNLEDIYEFAEVFAIAKRGGGEIRSIMIRTADIIGDKMEVKREIHTIMSEKMLEQKIMQCMPFGMIGYLSLTSPGFLDSLYHSVVGIILMTVCLGVYVFACFLAERILDINI